MFGDYTVDGLIRYFCKLYEIRYRKIDSKTIEADGVAYHIGDVPVTFILERIRRGDWKEEEELFE